MSLFFLHNIGKDGILIIVLNIGKDGILIIVQQGIQGDLVHFAEFRAPRIPAESGRLQLQGLLISFPFSEYCRF